jgi:UDP-N-acetylmuramate--alanine ligase
MLPLGNKELAHFNRVYFVGIGGIGMSALARYFHTLNWEVTGFDKTPSQLTNALIKEGIQVHFEDLGANIPESFKRKEDTLVIYTPAIAKNHGELNYFMQENFHLMKRSQVLGLITRNSKGLGVAGTHGKTTTSTLLAYILDQSSLKCNAFLGGISSNFNTNLVCNPASDLTVIEADEFDRSFLQLAPFASIVTSTDADHLDIYGDEQIFLKGFQDYVNLTNKEGFLVLNKGLDLQANVKTLTYSVSDSNSDYFGLNLRYLDGIFLMDVRSANRNWSSVQLGLPGIHNAENALACIAMTAELGLSEHEIRNGLKTFKGVKRRFEYHIKTKELVYIDDYAHHPTEIHALVSSIRLLYPNEKITGIFQPHLYSRTRDFFAEFARELSELDEVILLPIYAAREEPIEGVMSETLLDVIALSNKQVLSQAETLEYMKTIDTGIVLTIGAGDIDRLVEPLRTWYESVQKVTRSL